MVEFETWENKTIITLTVVDFMVTIAQTGVGEFSVAGTVRLAGRLRALHAISFRVDTERET